MLQFAWPLVAVAIVLPWLVARFAPPARPLATPLRVPFLGEARAWQQAATRARPRVRHFLAIAAWTLLVSAACRPQWIGEPFGVPATGRTLMVALDLSGSMRDAVLGGEAGIAVLRRTAREFIAARTGDRIGLIVFGSKAYVQSPPSFDLRAVADMADEAFIGLAGEGTALGDAVALGVARLRELQRDERVLVLLTDGSSTEGGVTMSDAARLASHHGVRVYAIGIGVPHTASAPQPGEGLDEAALQRVAAATGGRYFRAESGGALKRAYQEIGRHEPVARDERLTRATTELYAWPLGLALVLVLLGLAGGTRGTRGTRGARAVRVGSVRP